MPRGNPGKPRPGRSRLPFRKSEGGRLHGSWLVWVKNKRVNLRTKNADIALLRSKEAFAGVRTWAQDDGQGPAQAVADALTGTGGAQSPPVVERGTAAPAGFPPGSSPVTPAPALPPIPEAPPEGPPKAPPGVTGDYIPPPAGWADAVRGAASTASSAAPDDDGAGDGPDPEFVAMILGVAAGFAVELQLLAQAWIIKKRAKLVASPVPEDAKGREVATKLWTSAMRKWLPDDMPIPDWLAAPLMLAALTIPVQLTGAKPVDPNAPPAAAPSSPAPAV